MNNTCFISGYLVNIFDTQRNGIVRITVATGSNHPQVQFAGEMAQMILKDYKVGDPISVRGCFQSRLRDGISENNICGTELLSTSIGDGCFLGRNDFRLIGEIRQVQAQKGCTEITVRVCENGYAAWVAVRTYRQLPELVQEGGRVAITGTIQTDKKNVRGKIVHQVCYVAFHIQPAEIS